MEVVIGHLLVAFRVLVAPRDHHIPGASPGQPRIVYVCLLSNTHSVRIARSVPRPERMFPLKHPAIAPLRQSIVAGPLWPKEAIAQRKPVGALIWLDLVSA